MFCLDIYLTNKLDFTPLVLVASELATVRLQYEDYYEYEFSVLSTRFRFGWRKCSKCACSELKTRTRSRPRTPIRRSLIAHEAEALRLLGYKHISCCKIKTLMSLALQL